MAVHIMKGSEVKVVRTRERLEDQAIISLRKLVVAHDELTRARGVRRAKAARKFPLIMKKARRLVHELNPQPHA